MELSSKKDSLKKYISEKLSRTKSKFIKSSKMSQKKEIQIQSFKWTFLVFITFFIVYELLMPNSLELEFSEKLQNSRINTNDSNISENTLNSESSYSQDTATKLWNTSNLYYKSSVSSHSGSMVNYNTPMIMESQQGNAKSQFRAGFKIPLKIVDKFIVSQDSVPILAESILNVTTDSGIRIPAGSKFYGEASFQKGSEKAKIVFRQIALPSGEIKTINGIALAKQGQEGISGRVFSDGIKNSAGQVITSFIGGLASGSMQTDALGASKGGIENGLLAAVSETAKTQAEKYGEKLKAEREWIEVSEGTECDLLLKEKFNLYQGGE
ncbi:MAG: TrbI/VirB10 family protein [Bdellovibrionales bacterium]|nr:TrbI/VirB10 family protein [Bdellovibrionales bacterium]